MPKNKNTTDTTTLKYVGPYFIDGFLVGTRIWNPDRMTTTEIEEFKQLVPEAESWWVQYNTKIENDEGSDI
jgi:hypothetical protein